MTTPRSNATSYPPTPFCTHRDRCGDPNAVELADIHTATGPGRTLHACPTCTPHDPQLPTSQEEL
ncbi:hypothetical protein MTQ01_06190 [Streptomyces sp. XM4193]|uniref:hypothetical protein n=1 Tax=Streptomyces sp. XM4193 TaxID=2929782 RepID=UPI001FFB8CA7|nr:hypothetical protein [Streptomyces sp. XM4193]MCK1795603.1 hypothetical protein [Streptomyces sp. XM4193]